MQTGCSIVHALKHTPYILLSIDPADRGRLHLKDFTSISILKSIFKDAFGVTFLSNFNIF